MEKPNYTFNILNFTHPTDEFTFHFFAEEQEGLNRVYKSLVPYEIIEHFGEQNHYYTSFDANLDENVAIKKLNISEHFSNIFKEDELTEEVICRNFRLTTQHGAIEGKTQEISVNHYNLDVIISVGYRVKSQQDTLFRIGATKRLNEYIVKGLALNTSVSFSKHLNLKYWPITTLTTIICANICAISKNCRIFDTNNTCHASHKNSAPGQVFAFYRLLVFKSLNTKAHALQ